MCPSGHWILVELKIAQVLRQHHLPPRDQGGCGQGARARRRARRDVPQRAGHPEGAGVPQCSRWSRDVAAGACGALLLCAGLHDPDGRPTRCVAAGYVDVGKRQQRGSARDAAACLSRSVLSPGVPRGRRGAAGKRVIAWGGSRARARVQATARAASPFGAVSLRTSSTRRCGTTGRASCPWPTPGRAPTARRCAGAGPAPRPLAWVVWGPGRPVAGTCQACPAVWRNSGKVGGVVGVGEPRARWRRAVPCSSEFGVWPACCGRLLGHA